MESLTKAYSINLHQTSFRRTSGKNGLRTVASTATTQGFYFQISLGNQRVNDLNIHSSDIIRDFYQNFVL